MMTLPPIFIMCNPEKEPIRYQCLLKQFEKARIPLDSLTFVTDIWGSEMSSQDYFAKYDPFHSRFGSHTAISWKSAALSAGEVSLVRTFQNVVSKALAIGSEKVLVFESDTFLRADFLERFAELEGCLALPEHQGWDYVSLGEGVFTRPPGRERSSYFDPVGVYKPPHQWVFRCTDSMLFHRKFLEKVHVTLGGAVKFRECLDWELNFQMSLHQGKALWADPPLAEPGTGRQRFGSLLP